MRFLCRNCVQGEYFGNLAISKIQLAVTLPGTREVQDCGDATDQHSVRRSSTGGVHVKSSFTEESLASDSFILVFISLIYL